MAAGGCKNVAEYGDGAYRRRLGSFGNTTPGKIPRNVLTFGHNCSDHKAYRRNCENLGLPAHGAVFPATLPNFLIRFLTQPGEVVADPFGGKLTTGREAEKLGRRWISTELILEYIRGAAECFKDCAGFKLNQILDLAARSE